jgi:hypothetical protein
LLIKETYVKKSSKKTAMNDSGWQPGADEKAWPSFEIHPASAWNYGLLIDADHPEKSFTVVKKTWPADNNPFTNKTAPIQIKATGKLIPGWTIDQYGLCGLLPQSPVKADGQVVNLTLVPMGGARLRISSFPVIKN